MASANCGPFCFSVNVLNLVSFLGKEATGSSTLPQLVYRSYVICNIQIDET